MYGVGAPPRARNVHVRTFFSILQLGYVHISRTVTDAKGALDRHFE